MTAQEDQFEAVVWFVCRRCFELPQLSTVDDVAAQVTRGAGFLAGLFLALALEQDIEVVDQVSRGDKVLPAALAAQPDVALLDIEMPGGDGLVAAAELKERLPSCRVIILTTFGRTGYLRRAMESGAAGFLLKDGPLTDRERDVLAASVDGATIRDVAAELFLSEGTVRNYVSTAIQKLGARNRVEAARLAQQKGWL